MRDEHPLARPSVPRMYDYFLGGAHNFAIDRQAAERVLAVYPDLRFVAQGNRTFLRKVVTFLAHQGIEQFLDLGCGLPTVGSTHEIVQTINPAARVLYVDRDPIAVTMSEAILAGSAQNAVLQADLRYPDQVFSHPSAERFLDRSKPVAVLLLAVLHFVDEAEATAIVKALGDTLPTGSFLAISHATVEHIPPDVAAQIGRLYAATGSTFHPRTREEVAALLEGWELVEPGIVFVPLWRPEGPDDLWLNEPERFAGYAGVGRKP